MTNYEKLFQDQIKDPQFARAYREARMERILSEFLEILKEQISRDEPKEVLLSTINSIEKQLNLLQT